MIKKYFSRNIIQYQYILFAALRRYICIYIFQCYRYPEMMVSVHFFLTDYSTLYILYNHLVQRKSNFWTDSKPVKINILRFNALLELEQIKMIFFLERNCHLIFPCLFNRICFSNKKKLCANIFVPSVLYFKKECIQRLFQMSI